MPNTRSAKKALRQNVRRRARNLAKKRQIKTVAKEYRRLAEAGGMDAAKEKLILAYKALDKAAKTKIITKNKASRLKSKLALRLAKARSG